MMRCAVFIDGNNIFHSARQLGFEVDYSRLLTALVGKDRELLRAFFYTGVDEGADRQRGFLHWMRRNGFRVVQK
ncbi:MAG TPA: NYN domain-containing protein, partial [Holophaga sp.]|nr:NYN domain-containing protein [Holophaga sp.]